MATGEPRVDLFNPIIQALRDRFEQLAFPDGGLEDCEDEVGRLYNEEFKRPYICALMADVCSGRWKLGTTQEEISHSLGILSDRAWVSHALRQGRLSLDIFVRLRCCPMRPVDWEPNVRDLMPEMERSAFIGVAKGLASRIVNRPTLAPQRLNELNYELVCEILARLENWLPSHARQQQETAREMIHQVCLDQKRNVIPSWHVTRQRRLIEEEIERLTRDDNAAFEQLSQLQRDWLDVFVATYTILENVKWSKP